MRPLSSEAPVYDYEITPRTVPQVEDEPTHEPPLDNEASSQDTVGNAAVVATTVPPNNPPPTILNPDELAESGDVPAWAADVVAETGQPLVDPTLPTTDGDPPRELPPVGVGLATVASGGDPTQVALYIQYTVAGGSDEEVLQLAYAMPDLIATLPPEDQRVIGLALQDLGERYDRMDGQGTNDPAYQRMQVIGQGWYHEHGVLQNDQYGESVQDGDPTTVDALSSNKEHYNRLIYGEEGVHTDMEIPGIFWTEQGNLGRYLDANGVVYVGADGLRVMWSDGSNQTVTAKEMEVLDTLEFFGPGSVQLADGSTACMLRNNGTGEVQYVIRGPNGVQIVGEDGLPAPITDQGSGVTQATSQRGQDVEIDQGTTGENLVGAAFTGGLAGPAQNANFHIEQDAVQAGGNVFGLVASGDTLVGGEFTITQDVLGTGESQYRVTEDGTVEVAGHWGAVLDGNVDATSISVGGETPGPILVNGDIGRDAVISGSTVVVHGEIDPGATITADTVLVVGDDGVTRRWDPDTRELAPYDGETMRQEDPFAYGESLALADGDIDVRSSSTERGGTFEMNEGTAEAGYTTTTTAGDGSTRASGWSLGLGNGELSGNLSSVTSMNGTERTGGASVSFDPETGAVTVESSGGYRWRPEGPQVTGSLGFTWDDGQVAGVQGSVGGNWRGASIVFSAGVQDHDFAAFDGGGQGVGDEVVTYGQVNGHNLGASGEIPAGPVTIGVNGEVQRTHTVQAYTNASNLTGLDPSLAYTDPAAFREAVAAQMQARIAGVSTVTDVEAADLAGWQVGDGMVIQQANTDSLGGSLGVGAGPVDLSVGLSYASGRTEQVQMELVEDDPRTLSVTVSSTDTDTFTGNLDGGPLSLSSEGTQGEGSSVSFQFDLDSPEGQAAYEAYRTTTILPGALDYAQAQGLLDPDVDVTDPAQMREIAGQVNRQFLESPAFALGLTGTNGATYTGMALDRTSSQQEALSLFGFELLSHELVESWRDRLYLENGAEETERSYNRAESAWFSNDTETTGIVLNPEGAGPIETMLFSQENRGQILPSDLGPYLSSIPRDQLDPLTRAWLDGEVDDGSFDAVVSMGFSLTEDHYDALDLALDVPGAEDDARAADLHEAVTGQLDQNLEALGVRRVVHDDGSVTWELDETGEMRLYERQGTELSSGNPDYDATDYTAEVMGITLANAGVDTAALDERAAEMARYGIPLDVARQQVYEDTLDQLYGVEGQDEAFAQLPPDMQTVYTEIAARNAEDPWDVLDLVLEVPSGEARDELMRTTFATIEDREGGNNAVESFYQWTEDLDPQVRDAVRSGFVVRVHDRGTMDRMAAMSDRSAQLDPGAFSYFLGDYVQNPDHPINAMNNDDQNAIVTDLVAATELARAGDTAYLEELLTIVSSTQSTGLPAGENVGLMFAAMRDPALQGIWLDALATMDAATAGGASPTSYTAQALAWLEVNPSALVNGLAAGDPDTQAALFAQLEAAGADVDALLLAGGQQAMQSIVTGLTEGDPMFVEQARTGVVAVLGHFADDPATLQILTDALLATPGLAEASARYGGGTAPVEALLTTLALEDPGAGLDVLEALVATSHAPEAAAAIRARPELLFAFDYAEDGAQALLVMDRLEAMGIDPMPVVRELLIQDGQLNEDLLVSWGVDLTDPAALGELLADREQSHDLLGWTPETDRLSAILLYAAGQGPQFVTDVITAYEASGQRPDDDTITNLLDAMDKGSPAQVALAADALRTAGYGAEVDAWMAEHGGRIDLSS